MPVSQNKVVTPQGLLTGTAICTAAKTTYNDATGAVLLVTAGANGALIFSIRAVPRMTVSAVQLQLYSSTDGGVTLNLINFALMPAYTMGQTTVPSPVQADFGYTESIPLRLAANERLYVATGVAFATGIAFEATGENL